MIPKHKRSKSWASSLFLKLTDTPLPQGPVLTLPSLWNAFPPDTYTVYFLLASSRVLVSCHYGTPLHSLNSLCSTLSGICQPLTRQELSLFTVQSVLLNDGSLVARISFCFSFLLHLPIYVGEGGQWHTYHSAQVEIRGQLPEVGPLHTPWKSQRSGPGCWAWQHLYLWSHLVSP